MLKELKSAACFYDGPKGLFVHSQIMFSILSQGGYGFWSPMVEWDTEAANRMAFLSPVLYKR